MAQAVRRAALSVILLALFVPNAGCSLEQMEEFRNRLREKKARVISNASDETIRKMFEQANRACPKRVDAVTTIEEVVMVSDNRVEFRYSVNAAGQQLVKQAKPRALKQAFVKHLQGNPMAVAILERDLVLDHIYNDKAGNRLFSYAIDRSSLDGSVGPTAAPQSNPFDKAEPKSTADSAFYADASELESTDSSNDFDFSESPEPPRKAFNNNAPGMHVNPYFGSDR